MSRRNRKSSKPVLSYDIDIVIPVYGNFELLRRTIDALPEACGDKSYKLIIVDNNSPPQVNRDDHGNPLFVNQTNDLQRDYPDAKIIKNKENLGFARACNDGARSGRASTILFLNSDCIMHPGSIELLWKDLNNPSYGIVAPMLLFPSEQEYMDTGYDNFEFMKIRPAGKVQHVGMETNINGDFFHIFVGWTPDNPRVQRIEYPYAVTGACFMTRRSLWQRIGGFDLMYGQGTYEDVDYCMAVRKLGYNIHMVLDAVGTHYTGATSVKYNLPMPINENRTLFLQKWGRELQYTEWRYQ